MQRHDRGTNQEPPMSTTTTLIPTIPAGPTIVLTDDVLGFALVGPAFGGAVTLRQAVVDTSVTGTVRVRGVTDVLGAVDLTVELVIEAADVGAPDAQLSLTATPGTSWSVAGLRLDSAMIELRLHGEPGERQLDGTLSGTTTHGPITFDVSIALDEHPTWSMTTELGAPGSSLTLTTLLDGLVGSAALPNEVPDVTVERLAVSATPHTGAFTLDAACAIGWSLPFGGDGPAVGRVGVRAERVPATAEAPASTTVAIEVTTAASMPIADGFVLNAMALSFERDGSEGTWAVGGSVEADVVDVPVTFAASVTDGPEGRVFTFEEHVAEGSEGRAAVDLGGAGSLAIDRITVRVTRSRAGGEPASGVRLDNVSAYSWSVEAAGHLDLVDSSVVLDGTISLEGAPGFVRLALRPGADGRAASLDVTLP